MAQTEADQDQAESREQLSRWLEDGLGCSEVRLEKQRRWRPVWRATAKQNGVKRDFLLKGDRTWPTHPYPLVYEMHMQRALHENGIPIPAILGMCDQPNTIVMEWIEGGRDPGLVQQAIESASVMTDDRWAASLRYMEILADIHRLPSQAFVEGGAHLPQGAREIALHNFERFHAMTGEQGITDPLLEFCARWLRRNYPRHRESISFVTGDCGQFLSDGAQVTGILDVEIGHLADPLRDLACFRGRHPIENMGDVAALFRHYETAIGVPLDFDAIAYHTVSFLAEAIYGPLFGMHEKGRGGDWVEAAVQVSMIGRRCMEALAEILSVSLDAIALPPPAAADQNDLALDKLQAEIERLPESGALQGWQRNILASIPHYLRNQLRYRDWLREEDCKDIEALLGMGYADAAEGEVALMRFIEKDAPSDDAALTRFFHRRMLRQCLVIAGPDAPADHLVLVPMESLLRR